MIAAPDGQTLDQGAEPMGHPPVVMVNNDDRAEGVRYEVLARRTEKKPSVDGLGFPRDRGGFWLVL